MSARRAAAVLLALAALPAAAVTLYKWVDAHGVTHYSGSPPPQGGARRLELRDPPAARAPAAGDWRAREIEARKRRIERSQAQDKADAEARRQAASRRARCLDARARLDILQHGGPVYHVDERGERVYLDDAGRESETQRWQRQAQEACDAP